MKFIDFLYNDFSVKNNLKLRKIKLSICGAFLTLSFAITGYKAISLASVNNVNSKYISNKKSLQGFSVKSNR